MFARRPIETVMALLVIFGTIAFAIYASRLSEPSRGGGLLLKAEFQQIDGLPIDAPVRLSGVTVGKVAAMALDPARYTVTVTVSIAQGIVIYADAALSVRTSGLFGGKFIELDPGGGEDRQLQNGDIIPRVENAVLLDELVERIVSFGEQARKSGQ